MSRLMACLAVTISCYSPGYSGLAIGQANSEYLRYNKIKFVCLSVPSNRPQFPSDLHQTWHAASP